jgi:superoxide dismutase, Cu-Zn family
LSHGTQFQSVSALHSALQRRYRARFTTVIEEKSMLCALSRHPALLAAAAIALLAGCAAGQRGAGMEATMAKPAAAAGGAAATAGAAAAGGAAATGGAAAARAAAMLAPTQGNGTRGTVTFEAMGDHVMVQARVSGLKPNSEHGFHVHEKGDCSAPDAMSAGGHFNPGGKAHGPQDSDRHAGDMPNLKADANGNAEQKFMLMGVTIGSGTADIIGRSVIVHIQPDDYKTQPTGNSGARIACGVISRL